MPHGLKFKGVSETKFSATSVKDNSFSPTFSITVWLENKKSALLCRVLTKYILMRKYYHAINKQMQIIKIVQWW